MTAKQILDAFSETLMQDERILTPRERELLSSLLQNSRIITGHDPITQSAVAEVVARSVGETVAQRAFTLLGSSIVERIVAQSGIAIEETTRLGESQKSPPSPQPPSPPDEDVPPPSPQPPSVELPVKDLPPSPQPPGATSGLQPVMFRQATERRRDDSGGGVSVLEAPRTARAQCVVLDEFLAPQEVDELMQFVLQHETDFGSSEVISPSGDPRIVDHDHRRSRVLCNLGKHENVILDRIYSALPQVTERLGIDHFPVAHVESQITASNHGDFFKPHCDDAQASIASRHLTFVYFFHREPRQFGGGELRIHDSMGNGQRFVSTGSYQTVIPQQNQIVFFPCSTLHEITPVNCPSKTFADSRFTLNGWLHK